MSQYAQTSNHDYGDAAHVALRRSRFGRWRRRESAGNLPDLFDRVRQCGLLTVAEINIDLTDEDLPASTSHAVYRIVQEALTNAERHAPGASLTVEINADPGFTVVAESAGDIEVVGRAALGR